MNMRKKRRVPFRDSALSASPGEVSQPFFLVLDIRGFRERIFLR